ncbi:MAG: hypothetical protein ACI9E1_002250 [Cryomorphaceae bacterium]|jgi:hypothetical protein
MLDYKKLISGNAEEANGFIYPDWQKLSESIDKNYPEEHLDLIYNGLAKEWLTNLKRCLDCDFAIYESTNFFMLCNEEEHNRKNLIDACERSLKTILEQFAGALSDSGYGKHVLIVFNDVEQYERYTRTFSSSGESPTSSGMCIHTGYTHIVLPHITSEETPVATIAHELTHALLAEYQIPNWLDEAVAMRMEDVAVGYDGLSMDDESYNKHLKYWDENTIQDFWSGEVWGRDSAGFELSYDLARILWKKIAVDLGATKEEIVEFIETVGWEDSGKKAFKRIFDHTLGELVEDFLGEGNWEPDENCLMEKRNAYLNIKVWMDHVQPLVTMDREDLLRGSVLTLNPSDKLNQLFVELGVSSVRDIVQVSAERVYRHEHLFGETQDELRAKLSVLQLSLVYEEGLNAICDLMFIFRHGEITRGSMDGKQCVLMVKIDYLAEMINPDFKFFAVAFNDFGGFAFSPWGDENEQKIERYPLSLEDFVSLQPTITGSELFSGRVRVSSEWESETDQQLSGDFSFHASAVSVLDPEGKEWSIAALRNIEEEYWAGE